MSQLYMLLFSDVNEHLIYFETKFFEIWSLRYPWINTPFVLNLIKEFVIVLLFSDIDNLFLSYFIKKSHKHSS